MHLLLFSLVQTSNNAFAIVMLVFGFGFCHGTAQATLFLASCSVQDEWFGKHAGAAHAVSLTAVGIGTAISAPFAAGFIEARGWDGSLVLMTVISTLICGAGALMMKRKGLSVRAMYRLQRERARVAQDDALIRQQNNRTSVTMAPPETVAALNKVGSITFLCTS
jgi:hypothetical protein